jgi:hypothetical protein
MGGNSRGCEWTQRIVKMLFERRGSIISEDPRYWCYAIEGAAQNNHEAVVKLLLTVREEVKKMYRDIAIRESLERAADNGPEALVKLFLTTGKTNVEWLSARERALC